MLFILHAKEIWWERIGKLYHNCTYAQKRSSDMLCPRNGLKITGAADQIFQLFWESKKKTGNKGSSLWDKNDNCFFWVYLQSWHCKPHRLHRSHCWLLLPLLLHIGFHAWRQGRMRKLEACLKRKNLICHSPNNRAFYCIYIYTHTHCTCTMAACERMYTLKCCG